MPDTPVIIMLILADTTVTVMLSAATLPIWLLSLLVLLLAGFFKGLPSL